MFLLNSRSSLVTATPDKLRCLNQAHPGHPFSRSYGVNLPSSLTMVISHALVSSTCLPVSVCGTGSNQLTRGFSWQREKPLRFTSLIHSLSAELYVQRICLPDEPYTQTRTTNPVHGPTTLRHPIAQTLATGQGIYTLCPSTTPFGLALGPTKLKRTILP